MKAKKLISHLIACAFLAVLSLIIYFVFKPVFDSVWVFVIAFAALLFFCCFAFSVFDENNLVNKIMKLFCGWYFKSFSWGKEVGAYFWVSLIWIFTYGFFWCLGAFVTIALIISPVCYLVGLFKKQ